jgi:hemerythrin-like domain-containing protein
MSYPIHTLKHEHRVIEQALRALDGICKRFASGERVPSEALSELLEFIRTFADAFHHGKEEQHFFPALERKGIVRRGGPLEMMEREHEIERRLVRELGQDVKAYATARPGSWQHFVQTSTLFIELLTGHIQREDQVLFRIAEAILDEADNEYLSSAFRNAETEIGSGVLENCEKTAAKLERAWAA